jgi:hypothetical protein
MISPKKFWRARDLFLDFRWCALPDCPTAEFARCDSNVAAPRSYSYKPKISISTLVVVVLGERTLFFLFPCIDPTRFGLEASSLVSSNLLPYSPSSPGSVNCALEDPSRGMPKKHRHSSSSIKPVNTLHPSLSHSAASSSAQQTPAPQGVSERLARLRLESARSSSSSPSRSASASSHSTPLDSFDPVRNASPGLGGSQHAPSRQEPVARTRLSRWAAGPPPPASWLVAHRRKIEQTHASARIPLEGGIGSVPGVPEIPKRSLQDYVLRSMARNIKFHLEYDGEYLLELSETLRMALVHYVAVLGSEPVTLELLNLLFGRITDNDQTPNMGIHVLDLTHSVGTAMTLGQLGRFICPSNASKKVATLAIEESWDAAPLVPSLNNRFPALTHLSLANPASNILWADLLNFVKRVPTLTHLSLASWPAPTLTPNSITATTTSTFAPGVQTSGTGFYSNAIDRDWREATGILRRLSKATYCLEYLDLTGCNIWVPAIAHFSEHDSPASSDTDDADSKPAEQGIEWTTSWRSMKTVVVAQSWMPKLSREGQKLFRLEKYRKDFYLGMKNVESFFMDSSDKGKDDYERILQSRKKAYEDWVHCENATRLSMGMVNDERKEHGVRPCEIVLSDEAVISTLSKSYWL